MKLQSERMKLAGALGLAAALVGGQACNSSGSSPQDGAKGGQGGLGGSAGATQKPAPEGGRGAAQGGAGGSGGQSPGLGGMSAVGGAGGAGMVGSSPLDGGVRPGVDAASAVGGASGSAGGASGTADASVGGATAAKAPDGTPCPSGAQITFEPTEAPRNLPDGTWTASNDRSWCGERSLRVEGVQKQSPDSGTFCQYGAMLSMTPEESESLRDKSLEFHLWIPGGLNALSPATVLMFGSRFVVGAYGGAGNFVAGRYRTFGPGAPNGPMVEEKAGWLLVRATSTPFVPGTNAWFLIVESKDNGSCPPVYFDDIGWR